MTPNVADFNIYADTSGAVSIQCPTCYKELCSENKYPDTLRSFITMASHHARSAHAMSAPAAIKGA